MYKNQTDVNQTLDRGDSNDSPSLRGTRVYVNQNDRSR